MSDKLFTRADVTKHNSNKDCWLIIHNNIYDVTSFLNEHPGGEEVLLEQAGRDSTEHFEDVGHSSDAREMMNKYKVGELVEAERKAVSKKAEPTWTQETQESESSMKTWLLPLVLGLVATIAYRFFFSSSQ
ncbi:cytochrome b5 [Episyrphus balteatus]|uniref:cytochrome b5 n=1 Tax=Episyrphus balteatus TaxID=286459 RepID=UPI002485AA69|nr:cytochrome b5 [Episyrphus balteatus]